MNQSFYAAAVAASQQQQRLNVTANNLANVNTAGFKAEQANFSDLLYRNWTGPDNAQLPRGSGSRMIQTTTDFATGALLAREDGQNYAIDGDGFFALRNPETGETSYTRAGAFHWGSVMQGEQTTYYLCNAEGYYVLDQNQQPIALGQDPEGIISPGSLILPIRTVCCIWATTVLRRSPRTGRFCRGKATRYTVCWKCPTQISVRNLQR